MQDGHELVAKRRQTLSGELADQTSDHIEALLLQRHVQLDLGASLALAIERA